MAAGKPHWEDRAQAQDHGTSTPRTSAGPATKLDVGSSKRQVHLKNQGRAAEGESLYVAFAARSKKLGSRDDGQDANTMCGSDSLGRTGEGGFTLVVLHKRMARFRRRKEARTMT